VAAALIHVNRTDRQTGRHDEANSLFPQTQPNSIAQTKPYHIFT